MENTKPVHAQKNVRLLHIIMGCVILVHGMERLEKHYYYGIIFMFAGIIFLCCATFHKKLIKRFPFVDIVFHSLEGLLAVVVAVEYFNESKKYIPYFYLVPALFYFFAAVIQYNRGKKVSVPIHLNPSPGEQPANE